MTRGTPGTPGTPGTFGPGAAREGTGRTLLVAASVCLACSVLVSVSVQLLEPLQEANRAREDGSR